jgi:quinol monooxygenase YgiN
MIHVVATIKLKPGCRDGYLKILKSIVSDVRGEKGCLTYGPTIDMETDIEIQEITGENTVTMIESWESVEALKEHALSIRDFLRLWRFSMIEDSLPHYNQLSY